jgi:hypothetical protein
MCPETKDRIVPTPTLRFRPLVFEGAQNRSVTTRLPPPDDATSGRGLAVISALPFSGDKGSYHRHAFCFRQKNGCLA